MDLSYSIRTLKEARDRIRDRIAEVDGGDMEGFGERIVNFRKWLIREERSIQRAIDILEEIEE